MNITKLPFNAHVGLDRPRGKGDEGQLLRLRDTAHARNHLGTVHAGALFTLAEASSGEFLIRHRGDREDIGGVVRRATCKYSAPACGTIVAISPTDPAAIAKAVDLVDAKGRALVSIEIDLQNAQSQTVARFTFDWFLGLSSE